MSIAYTHETWVVSIQIFYFMVLNVKWKLKIVKQIHSFLCILHLDQLKYLGMERELFYRSTEMYYRLGPFDNSIACIHSRVACVACSHSGGRLAWNDYLCGNWTCGVQKEYWLAKLFIFSASICKLPNWSAYGLKYRERDYQYNGRWL